MRFLIIKQWPLFTNAWHNKTQEQFGNNHRGVHLSSLPETGIFTLLEVIWDELVQEKSLATKLTQLLALLFLITNLS